MKTPGNGASDGKHKRQQYFFKTNLVIIQLTQQKNINNVLWCLRYTEVIGMSTITKDGEVFKFLTLYLKWCVTCGQTIVS